MSKKIVFFVVIWAFFAWEGQAVNFTDADEQEKWETALERAKKEDKLIFLVFHSESCQPCAELKENTFTDLALSVYLNKSFVNVLINVETSFGIEKTEEFDVRNLPVMFILDPAGHDISGKLIGYQSPEKIIELGEEYADKYLTLSDLRQRFYGGEKDEITTLKFAYMLHIMKYTKEGDKIAGMYFQQNEVFNYIPEEWALIRNVLRDIDNIYLNRFLNDIQSFTKIYGTYQVDQYLSDIFTYNFDNAILKQDTSLLQRSFRLIDLMTVTDSFFGLPKQRLKDYVILTYYEFTEQWNTYAEKAVDYISTYEIKEEEYREFIVRFYLHVDDPKMNKLSNSWAKKIYSKNKVFSNILVYALTQNKIGKTAHAIKLLDKAGEIASTDEERALIVELSQQFSQKR